MELLNEIQVKILEVYSLRALSCCEPLLESSYTLCASSMETALYKATNHLLDDLSRNARLLGTPERYDSAINKSFIAFGLSLIVISIQSISLTSLKNRIPSS